jgi:transposase
MAVGIGIPVDIPSDKGVHIKSAGAKGEKYVYIYTGYFRNSDGNPRNKSVSLGKYDEVSGKMMPNGNYFERYKINRTLSGSRRWDYGYSYLILKVCRDTELLECLIKAFGRSAAADIIVMAAYIIREGNAMDGLDDWQGRNFFPGHSRLLNSAATSRCFASYTYPQRTEFFRHWVIAAMTGDTVCYDVTSVSSYAKKMTSVERGYNRDGDDLAQFNLGMFCDEGSKTPLYCDRYNGSLTDRTNLANVLANAGDVGIRRVRMILDGGFWIEECVKNLSRMCVAFTVGLPASQEISRKTIADYGFGIDSYANELSGRNIFCVQIETVLYDISGKIMLYYDESNHSALCKELSEYIDRLKAELRDLKRYPKSKLSRYEKYFSVTKHSDDPGFDFSVKTEAIDRIRADKGFFLLFTTDMNASPSDILDFYRAKDADEKIFSQIKVDMAGSRIRTHNEATTDGKTFVTFVACAIRSYLLGNLKQYMADSSTSLKKALNQLCNIEMASGADGFRFVRALTKKQKQILSAFNADKDILSSVEYLSTLNL